MSNSQSHLGFCENDGSTMEWFAIELGGSGEAVGGEDFSELEG